MDSTQNNFFNNICCAASTPVCNAVVSGSSYIQAGINIIISWVATGAVSYDVFIDGAFQINTTNTFFNISGPSPGAHTYNIVPRCLNGVAGTARSGAFSFDNSGVCTGVVLTANTARDNNDVLISYTLGVLAGVTADLFIDGIFFGNSSAQAVSNVFKVLNGADCSLHTYLIVAKCSNGIGGTSLNGTFQYCVPCAATVSQSTATRQGNDVLIAWTGSGAVSYDVFIDGAFITNTIGSTYLKVNGVDGLQHVYTILSKCANGPGTSINGEWSFIPDPPACSAVVFNVATTQQGNDVLLTWEGTGAVAFNIYIDNTFRLQVNTLSYLISGAADSYLHTFRIDPVCAGGGIGDSGEGNFTFSPITHQSGIIQTLNCVTSGEIIDVAFRAQSVIVLGGHPFSLSSGQQNTSRAPVGVGLLMVQVYGDAGSIRVTDSNGVTTCINHSPDPQYIQTYTFVNFAITAAGNFSIVLDCAACS